MQLFSNLKVLRVGKSLRSPPLKEFLILNSRQKALLWYFKQWTLTIFYKAVHFTVTKFFLTVIGSLLPWTLPKDHSSALWNNTSWSLKYISILELGYNCQFGHTKCRKKLRKKKRNHYYTQRNFEIQQTMLKSQATIFLRYQSPRLTEHTNIKNNLTFYSGRWYSVYWITFGNWKLLNPPTQF